MASAMVLAKDRKLQGVFSQRKLLWNLIEELEGIEPTTDTRLIPTVLIKAIKGKIETPMGKAKQMTYANFCSQLRLDHMVALHDAGDFTPKYGVWQVIINEKFTEMEIDTV